MISSVFLTQSKPVDVHFQDWLKGEKKKKTSFSHKKIIQDPGKGLDGLLRGALFIFDSWLTELKYYQV